MKVLYLLISLVVSYVCCQMFSIDEKIKVIKLYETNPTAAQNYVGKKLQFLDSERILQQSTEKIINNNVEDNTNCTCECILRPFWEYVEYGYGKYCGADYTCYAEEPGCDSLDACCKTHDDCVTETGYCGSCQCNLHLANCTAVTSGPGFCGKLEEARTGILDDICFVIWYAPSFCGGCPDGTPIPPICQNYSSSFLDVVSKEKVAQKIMQEKSRNKL